MIKLLKYMKGYGRDCALGPLFKLLEAVFELLIPLVVARIVDVGVAAGDRGFIVRMCLLMVLLGLVGLVCAITAQYFAARTAVGFAARVRHAVMAHILSLGYTEQDALGGATLVTRMTSDINQVQNGVNLTLRLLLRSPFVVFGAMIMAFTIDFQAALVFVVLIAALCLVVFGIMLITMPMYRRVQVGLDGITAATRENLAGVRVLRAFCKEDDQIRSFSQRTEVLKERQLLAGRVSGLMNPLTFAILNLAVAALIQVGALRVDAGVLTQGLVVALYNYMSQILVELVKMANLIINMTKAAACGNRVQALLEVQALQTDGPDAQRPLGGVEFRDVTASYAGAAAPALEGISFLAQPGQTIGVIGGTGSGKTTLVNLIPRFYDASSGQVLLDGRPVDSLNRQALRQGIGMVPQRSELFQGTIRENLLWGDGSATDEELWQALETAQAGEVVRDKGGLDSPVSQGGANFSGGQRQRLTIARALVRKPRILILDDSASALDYATDAALRGAIQNLPEKPTVFVVSQRAASVRYADQILVLDEGKLVGQGNHGELLASCPVYREIYYSQFPREEAAHE